MTATKHQIPPFTDAILFDMYDLFCGAGGVTEGAEAAMDALGRKICEVAACVNHDAGAIASHAANNPHVHHFQEDIRTLKMSKLVRIMKERSRMYPNRKRILWASAECTNYSNAKGGQSRDGDSRTLANHLLRYIWALKPHCILIENVREFMAWGPLQVKVIGKRMGDTWALGAHCPIRWTKKKGVWVQAGPVMIPESRTKGRDYLAWVEKIKRLGYKYEFRLLNAADYGGHTKRIRYFGAFYKEGFTMVFPEQTHVDVKRGLKVKTIGGRELKPWPAVREVLELNDVGESIFTCKKPKVDRTLKRLLAGLKKHVPVETAFLSKYYGSMDGTYSNGSASINDPAPTIRTKDGTALVTTYLQTYYGSGGFTPVNQSCPTLRTKDTCAQVSVMRQFMDKAYNSEHNHQSLEDPCGTLTCNGKMSLVTAVPGDGSFILDGNGYENRDHSLDEPCPTLLASRRHHYLINPSWFDESGGTSVDQPCPTIVARGDKSPLYLITAEKGEGLPGYDASNPIMQEIVEFMIQHGICDIRMRMLKVRELKLITGFPEDYILIGGSNKQKWYIGNAVPCIIPQRWMEALATAA